MKYANIQRFTAFLAILEHIPIWPALRYSLNGECAPHSAIGAAKGAALPLFHYLLIY